MKIIPFLIAATLTAGSPSMVKIHAAGLQLPTDISQKAKPATIKVLISKNKPSVLLEAKGSYRVYNPLNGLLLSTGVLSKRAPVSLHPEGIIWGELFSGLSKIRLVPADNESTILVNGIEYRGCMEIHALKDTLNTINEIDIERYLKSTLSCLDTAELDNEVVEALAIVARTHAHFLTNHTTDASWHIDAEEVGYKGQTLALQNLQIEHAINNTRNMIMTFNGAPFAASWTKDSAGKTANFSTVFRKDVKTPQGVNTPIAGRERAQHGWFFEISKQQLARIAEVQKISEIDLYQDKDSQKVYALRIKNGNTTKTLDFLTLQKDLGPSLLKSNDFTLEIKGEKIHFTGYGEGHGVGLCLLSASCFANKGEKSHQILSHFFPNTHLQHVDLAAEKKEQPVSE